MRQNANTVVRFITKKSEISTDWEKVLDSEVLKDIKPGSTINERLKYTMEMVNDGEETLSKIQSMAGKHDLIIVGRRNNVETPQTSCLDHKLSEFPKLRIVGNFLVTKDLPRRYSVLVVQQQLTT
ncbi:hypothetical protein Ddye_021718 [Dipteronia dyeriana]|uniref:Uncharacterized protein n=1 Tax=Dipteronia dyeriana TaxID=168575 RepID=A0AAD9U2W3_9ROSI|nr:hypothetical protein Ddye_021718 [Dipteronia dyeriana]